MKYPALMNLLYLIFLLLFLAVSVAQLSERLKYKTIAYHQQRPQAFLDAQKSDTPVSRLHALLGGVCILLAAFWGFDVLLAWWLYIPT